MKASEKPKNIIRNKNIINYFENDCKIRGLETESIRNYLSNIRIFQNFANKQNKDLTEVDKFILRDFVLYLREERNVSQKRAENYFSALSSLYEYLEYEGLVSGIPGQSVRKRYLKRYKENDKTFKAKVISEQEMGEFINSILERRDKAIVTLLAKTGIRRGELMTIDLNDIDWGKMSIRLKDKKKRSNTLVFFDDEASLVLKRWIKKRKRLGNGNALFPGKNMKYIDRNAVYNAVVNWAERFGIHDSESDRREDHFSPHNLRHCFTTYLRRAGMSREFRQELRGDKRKEVVDIYDQIDEEELRKEYMAKMPKFGIA